MLPTAASSRRVGLRDLLHTSVSLSFSGAAKKLWAADAAAAGAAAAAAAAARRSYSNLPTYQPKEPGVGNGAMCMYCTFKGAHESFTPRERHVHIFRRGSSLR